MPTFTAAPLLLLANLGILLAALDWLSGALDNGPAGGDCVAFWGDYLSH